MRQLPLKPGALKVGTNRFRPLGLCAALACATALPVQAQQVFNLDEIVFSANFAPTLRNRTGSSVTVVDADQLQKAGDQQLSTLLSRLPGVSVYHSGGPGQEASLRMRGSDPRYVAVYVDGIRVDDTTTIGRAFDFRAMTTGDIGRIEILRGSQSAMFGGSAVAGVINITSRRAAEEGFSQSFNAEIGSYDTATATYSLGFRDDRLEASMNVTHLRTRGFSAYDTLPKNPANQPDGFEGTRLSFSARYQVSEDLAVGGSAFLVRANGDYDDFGADANNRSARQEIGARAFAEYRTGIVLHEVAASRYKVTRDFFSPAQARYTGTRDTLSYQATAEVSDQFTLILGADTTRETGVTPSNIINATRTSGVYGQALWAPTTALDVSLTARIDRDSDFGNFPSGRLAVAWQAADGVTLRGAVARGYLSPTIFQRFGEPLFGIGPNPGLTPERSRSAELGVDVELAGGAILSATAFYIAVDNAIDYVFGAPPTYQNLPGTSPRKGLELAAQLPLGEAVVLGATYTYTDARQPNGTRAARVPRHDLGVTLDAVLNDRLTGTLALHHVADRPNDGFPAQPMPDYTVVNAGLRYALTPGIDLSLRVENLFNAQYQQVLGYGTAERSVYIGLASRF